MWVVTRQRPYYQPGVNLVEIAWGGRDYSGSDALTAKYLGEFEEFIEACEALKVAIAIRDHWNLDDTKAEATIGHGSTGGGMCEIEPSEETDDELLQWAKERDAKLERCYCGTVLGKMWYSHPDIDEEKFCSEYCAARFWEECQDIEEEVE